MKVPAFLLRRLYVKGSLRTTHDGFEFELNNHLGSGYAKRMSPLILDGESLDISSTSFSIDDKETLFSNVSDDIPFTLAMNKTTTIKFAGPPLGPGQHTIGLRFDVTGIGELGFEFTDIITYG